MGVKRILAFLLCLLGALLPCRLRVLYSEALGWIAQLFSAAVRWLVAFIVRRATGETDPDRESHLPPTDGSKTQETESEKDPKDDTYARG